MSDPPASPERAIKLLDEWMADQSGYDEETWPIIKAELERAVDAQEQRSVDAVKHCEALTDALERAETMLRQHADWTDGVYIRNPDKGADEDLVIVHLPNKVAIIDLADDARDRLSAYNAAKEGG